MLTAGSVAFLAANIPLSNRLCVYVVVDGMAAIARRTGGPLHIVFGVEGCPPIGSWSDEVWGPFLMLDIPLRTKREVVIADSSKVFLS